MQDTYRPGIITQGYLEVSVVVVFMKVLNILNNKRNSKLLLLYKKRPDLPTSGRPGFYFASQEALGIAIVSTLDKHLASDLLK